MNLNLTNTCPEQIYMNPMDMHTYHSCRIIMVAMDGEHRQADVDVLVLKIRSTKPVARMQTSNQ